MGEGCCGGHNKPRGWGIYTDTYYANVERSKMRMNAINNAIKTLGSDGVLIKEELNAMNRAGNEVIANNHQLRAEIYDLKAQIDILSERINLMLQAETIEGVKKASLFPFKEQFRPVEQ